MVDGCLVAKSSIFFNQGASLEAAQAANPIPKPPRAADNEEEEEEECGDEDASGEFEHQTR